MAAENATSEGIMRQLSDTTKKLAREYSKPKRPASEAVNLNKQKRKSKVLKYSPEIINPITLDGEALEEVEIFTSLGSIIYKQGIYEAYVKVRIGKASAAFLQVKHIWNSKQLSTNIKARIFSTNVKTVL